MTNSLWQRPMKDMLWHILVTHICVMEVWDGNSVTENAWHILCDENLETDILWRTMVTDVVWWICCDRLCDEYVVMDYDNGCDRLNTYYDMTDYWCLKILWQNSSQSLWILDKIFVKGFFFFLSDECVHDIWCDGRINLSPFHELVTSVFHTDAFRLHGILKTY